MNAAQGAANGRGGDAAAAPAVAVAVAASGGGTAAAGPPTVRDRQALTWARMSAGGSLPPPRSGAASVVVKGKLYMFGVSFRSLYRMPGCTFCVCFCDALKMSENCLCSCPPTF